MMLLPDGVEMILTMTRPAGVEEEKLTLQKVRRAGAANMRSTCPSPTRRRKEREAPVNIPKRAMAVRAAPVTIRRRNMKMNKRGAPDTDNVKDDLGREALATITRNSPGVWREAPAAQEARNLTMKTAIRTRREAPVTKYVMQAVREAPVDHVQTTKSGVQIIRRAADANTVKIDRGGPRGSYYEEAGGSLKNRRERAVRWGDQSEESCPPAAERTSTASSKRTTSTHTVRRAVRSRTSSTTEEPAIYKAPLAGFPQWKSLPATQPATVIRPALPPPQPAAVLRPAPHACARPAVVLTPVPSGPPVSYAPAGFEPQPEPLNQAAPAENNTPDWLYGTTAPAGGWQAYSERDEDETAAPYLFGTNIGEHWPSPGGVVGYSEEPRGPQRHMIDQVREEAARRASRSQSRRRNRSNSRRRRGEQDETRGRSNSRSRGTRYHRGSEAAPENYEIFFDPADQEALLRQAADNLSGGPGATYRADWHRGTVPGHRVGDGRGMGGAHGRVGVPKQYPRNIPRAWADAGWTASNTETRQERQERRGRRGSRKR